MTGYQRQRKYRERMTRSGFALKQVWVHKDDEQLYQSFLATIRRPDSEGDADADNRPDE